MKNIYKILYTFLVLQAISCGDKDPGYCDGGWDTRMKIINNNTEGLYIMHSAAYPDTNSYYSLNNYSESKYSIGYVNGISEFVQREHCTWDEYFNRYVHSDTLMIFIILDEGQGGKYHINTEGLLEQHTVLKRYDLTLQNLENMNWTITYP